VRELTEGAFVFFVVGWAKAANGAKQRPESSIKKFKQKALVDEKLKT
jgi:hypothetical protein